MKKTLIILSLVTILAVCIAHAAAVKGSRHKQKINPPQFMLTLPRDGQSVIGNAMTVQVGSENTKIKSSSGKNKPNEGHLRVTVDANPSLKATMTTYRLNIATLEEGEHALTVELVQNDDTSFDPPVKKSLRFSVIRSAVKGGNQLKPAKNFHPGRLFSAGRI